MPRLHSIASFGHAIAAARKQRGWTQAELGRQVGLAQTHISKVEAGAVAPRLDTVLELFRVLDLELLPVSRPHLQLVQSVLRQQNPPQPNANGDIPRLYEADPEPDDDEFPAPDPELLP